MLGAAVVVACPPFHDFCAVKNMNEAAAYGAQSCDDRRTPTQQERGQRGSTLMDTSEYRAAIVRVNKANETSMM